MAAKAKIQIKDVKKFILPLKTLSSSINSVIFTKNGDSLMVNASTADGSQKANIRFTNKTVQITEGAETFEKLGIFDLGQFISSLSLIETSTIEMNVNDNVLVIKYNEKSNLEYMLTELSLIKEGPAELKKDPEFVTVVEINNSFIKKVKSVASGIGANILRLTSKGGSLSYTVGDRNGHSHKYKEVLVDSGLASDFEVLLSIKDEKRSNFEFLVPDFGYKMSIHPRIIQLVAVTEDYELIRFFLSPIAE